MYAKLSVVFIHVLLLCLCRYTEKRQSLTTEPDVVGLNHTLSLNSEYTVYIALMQIHTVFMHVHTMSV